MAVLTVIKTNNVSVALPDDTLQITVDIYDLDGENGTGRNQNGEQFRDRVAVKRKVVAKWGLISPADMATILQATESEFFTLVYPDPKMGKGRQMTCYVGDRSAPMFLCNSSVTNGGNLNGMWSGLSMDFIEK